MRLRRINVLKKKSTWVLIWMAVNIIVYFSVKHIMAKLNANSRMPEDLLNMEIPEYLPNFKNPCWYTKNKKLKCLPYFQLLGNDKCGTTDLYSRLMAHPQILKNSGILGKETYWWAWTRYGHFFKEQLRDFADFPEYVAKFDGAADTIGLTVKENTSYHTLVVGDGSPMTFWDLGGWPQIQQNKNEGSPQKTTAHLIKHLLPNCKLIAMFRNPTARTYSDYHSLGQMRFYSTTPELFHERVLESIDIFEECARKNNAAICAFNWSIIDTLPVRIHISMYILHLKEWLRVYRREEIFIIRTEDYNADIIGTLRNVTKFLDLENYPENVLKAVSLWRHQHETPQKQMQSPMLPETKTILDNYYKMYNYKLATTLKNDIFLWKD